MSDHLGTTVAEQKPAQTSNAAARRRTRSPVMTPAEWRRRLLHILPGFLPLILWYIPHRDPLTWDARGWMALVIVSICASTAIKYRQIARRGETMNVACILGYALPVFLLLMLIPAHVELGLTVLAVLAIGDGSATMVGMIAGGPRLPWNRDKSWSGLISFLVLGSMWATLIYWGEANPSVPLSTAVICGATAAIVAGISESLDSDLDDNIRVGIAATIGVVAAHGLVVGW